MKNQLALILCISLVMFVSRESFSQSNSNPAGRSDFWMEACETNETLCSTFAIGYYLGANKGIDSLSFIIKGELINVEEKLSNNAADLALEIVEGCPDGGVIISQKVKVWIRYLENHPEEHHFSPAGTFQRALLEAFPCEWNKNGKTK